MITLQPIGVVRGRRTEVRDDFWGDADAVVELAPEFPPEAFDGIEEFSHVEVIFHLDRVPDAAITQGARHPRGNPAWPAVGVFAQRTKARPNRIGATIVQVVGRDGRRLHVRGLDALDGTPVLDVKPVLAEFLPRGQVRQPEWSRELMRDYWKPEGEGPAGPGA